MYGASTQPSAHHDPGHLIHLLNHQHLQQSGDTGGILEDDWVTPVRPKLNFLARLQPQPSLLYWGGQSAEGEGQVCLVEGAYANPRCQG